MSRDPPPHPGHQGHPTSLSRANSMNRLLISFQRYAVHVKMYAEKYAPWLGHLIYFCVPFLTCRYRPPHFSRLFNNVPFYTFIIIHLFINKMWSSFQSFAVINHTNGHPCVWHFAYAQILTVSPKIRVPGLKDAGNLIWETLPDCSAEQYQFTLPPAMYKRDISRASSFSQWLFTVESTKKSGDLQYTTGSKHALGISLFPSGRTGTQRYLLTVSPSPTTLVWNNPLKPQMSLSLILQGPANKCPLLLIVSPQSLN